MEEVKSDGAGQVPPDPELVECARRRRFTAEHKLRVLREAEACTEPGQVGALLRREGLYSSHLTEWRRQRDPQGSDRSSGVTPPSTAPPSSGR